MPVALASKVTLSADAAPYSRIEEPEIVAFPLPVTAPLTVTSLLFAHKLPELSTALLTISPPLPVASSVPELEMTLLPVSRRARWSQWRRSCLR